MTALRTITALTLLATAAITGWAVLIGSLALVWQMVLTLGRMA